MRSLTIAACAAVLFLFLFLSAVAWAEEDDKPCASGYAYSTEYATAAGSFKVVGAYGAYEAGCGGLNYQSVITPKGKIIRLAPFFRPDGSPTLATEGILVRPNYTKGFTSVGRKVFLVMTFGVWEWVPKEETFGKVMAFPFMVSGLKHQTSLWNVADGDVYHLLPEDGNSLFRGLLYFEKEEGGDGGRWILAEYQGKEKSSYPLRLVSQGHYLKIGHVGHLHDPWWWVSQEIVESVTTYSLKEYVFYSTYYFSPNDPHVPTRTVAARDILHEPAEIWKEETEPRFPCSGGCELREREESSYLLGDTVFHAEIQELDPATGRFTVMGCSDARLFGIDYLFLQTIDGEEGIVVNHGRDLFRSVPSMESKFVIVNMEALGDDWAFSKGPVTLREIVAVPSARF